MPRTILIVEDHSALLTSLRLLLEAVFPGCRIVEAASGSAAMAVAGRQRPDIILIDIDMAHTSGLETARRIKAALPETKVVMFTIHEDDLHRDDAAGAGASAYIPKCRFETDLIPVLEGLLGTGMDK